MYFIPDNLSINAKKDMARLAFSSVVSSMDEQRYPVTDDLKANADLMAAIYEFILISTGDIKVRCGGSNIN